MRDTPKGYRKVLTDRQWNTFNNLFRSLHLAGGVKQSTTGDMYFVVDKVSWSNGDSEKGIVYSARPLTPLLVDLDGYRLAADPKKRIFTVFKPIQKDWYIFLFISP